MRIWATSCASGVDVDLATEIETIQKELFAIGARLADPRSRIAERVTKAAIQPADIERLERLIDTLESEVPPLRRFILPGGSASGALLHQARTVCRRVERRVVALGAEAVDPHCGRLPESPVGPAVRDGARGESPRRCA